MATWWRVLHDFKFDLTVKKTKVLVQMFVKSGGQTVQNRLGKCHITILIILHKTDQQGRKVFVSVGECKMTPVLISEYVNIPGRCFAQDVSKLKTPVFEWRPCSDQRVGNGMGDKDGFCQVGAGSISFSQDNHLVFIGAPGRNYGQGQVSKHRLSERLGRQRMTATRTFENYDLLKLLKNNKAYSKVSV